MKFYKVVLAIWVLGSPVMAQKTIEKHMDFSGKDKIMLDIRFADSITIHTWNKDEVYAKATITINENTDNDAYVTRFEEKGSEVHISSTYSDGYFKRKKDCCVHAEIIWTLFVPEYVPFSVETIDGNIIIDGKTKEVHAKSISGFVDLSLDPSVKADLDLRTISGTLYSNLDLAIGKGEASVPQNIQVNLNQGGYPVTLETISGDIFLRKTSL